VLKRKYNYQCDIWSCGVILFVLLSGHPPFNAKSRKALFQKIIAGKLNLDTAEWKLISNEAKDMLRALLCVNPIRRISINDCLKHPWIVKFTSELTIPKTLAEATINNLKAFNVRICI
jgi:calcium-dependent protein kinase